MNWCNSGFERNSKAEVFLIWECSECGCEIVGNGLEKPTCDCPSCKAKMESEEQNAISD